MECDHENTDIRKRTIRNGAVQIWEQCLDCGRALGGGPKPHREYDLAKLKDWDRRFEFEQEELWEAERRERIASIEEKERAWRAKYEAYLLSPEWQRRRRKILHRDPICQGCLTRPSQEVHHTTYKHMGREFAFELVALCSACHRRYHNRDDMEREMDRWLDP